MGSPRLALAVGLTIALVAAALTAGAQLPGKEARIGVLDASSAADASARVESFRAALRELGRVEGRNVKIEWRFAEGRSAALSKLAAELAATKPDVLVSPSGGGVRALHNATRAIPIVMAGADAESDWTFPGNLARPAGNVTGVISIERELEGKRMELLREVLPTLSRVATFPDYTEIPYREGRDVESRSERHGVTFVAIIVGGPEDFAGAFAAAIEERAEALSLPNTPMLYTHRRRLASLAVSHRLAWVAVEREYAEAGCLLSYGADRNQLIRRAAMYVDRLLKGARPADLPIEQPTASSWW